ncbi:hypothetical protein ACFFRR_002997 [Megaselia abdita]
MKVSAVLFVYFCVGLSEGFICFTPREVCGQQKGTQMCRRFINICKMNWHNSFMGPHYEQVPMNTCQPSKFGSAPCIGTSTFPPFCDPNIQCTPLPTNTVCGIQTSNVLPHEEFCRTFRNQCEFDKYHCLQNTAVNPVTFSSIDVGRCNGLSNIVAPCV